MGQLDLIITLTGGGELFLHIGIAQVLMHPTEHFRDGESTELLTHCLCGALWSSDYVEIWQQVAVSQRELISIQKLPLRDDLMLSTGLIHFFLEEGCQVIV